jgi:diaminohydroxyphosphoribosylaminopyrimidine deaminase/5-amino-6-(5-phosphoribosylamino)uracil reductase
MDGKTRIAYVDDPEGRLDELNRNGASTMRFVADGSGRVSMKALMAAIGSELGATSVLVEGGAETASTLLAERLVDEYICTIAPKIVGGSGAPGPVAGVGIANEMREAVQFSRLRIRRSGPDAILRCELAPMV